MRTSISISLLVGYLLAPAAGAATFTVGADGACTHANLLSAISAASANGAGLDQIRVATNQTYSAVIAPIAGHSVTVRGGYSNCSDTTASGFTVISGATAGSNGTFSTSGAAGAYVLNLENLTVRDGGNATRRGGALRIEGNFRVNLSNTIITANTAARGGGIYIDGSSGAEVEISTGSDVSNNTANVSGGGIYCQNGGEVRLHGVVISNDALDLGSDPLESGNGGGVALYGCSMYHGPSLGVRGVIANTAVRNGGGYYLRNGSSLEVEGSGVEPGKITDNVAGYNGGGLAVNDDPAPAVRSVVEIKDSFVEDNLAPIGSGIGLLNGGTVTMVRTLAGAQCHDASYCSSLSRNDVQAGAGDFCWASAAWIGPRASLRLLGTRVEENCIAHSGTAFRMQQDGELRFDSSIIANNAGAPFFIESQFGGLLEIAWSTVTGNFATGHLAFLTVPNDASDGTVRIYGSLLGEPFQQMLAVDDAGALPPMTFVFDCLVVDPNYAQTLAPIRGVELAAPYGMIAPASGNFRLASGNALPADWCDASLAARAGGDADGVSMIHDAPRANGYGAHDPGAYEFVVAQPVAIFANGFE